MSGIHPDSAELQMHADGEVRNERVAAHVASCATCRDEVAAVRRVTAALSLGSKAPDSLTARTLERRASARRATALVALRPRPRLRSFMLPVGLAAAAALVLLMPRAWRNTAVEDPATSTSKGEIVARDVVFRIVLAQWSQALIDSLVVEALKDSAGRIEIAYVAGNGSADAEFADRIARQLQAQGVDRSKIVLRRVEVEEPSTPSLRALGVTVTIFARRGAAFQP